MVFLFYFNVQSQDKRKTDPTLTNNILYVWYCGSFCGCGFKKNRFKKIIFVVVDWIKICVWLKIRLKLLLYKKQLKSVLLKVLLIIK